MVQKSRAFRHLRRPRALASPECRTSRGPSIRQRQHAIVSAITAAAHREDRQFTGTEGGAQHALKEAAEKHAARVAFLSAQWTAVDMQLTTVAFDFDQRTQGRHADLRDRLLQAELAGLRMLAREHPAADTLAQQPQG